MAKILVIDDDSMAREIITEMLSQSRHQAVNASDGRDGLHLSRNDNFDIVITDMIMPNVEGVETIIQLRKDNPAVKIIAISGGGKMSAYSLLSIAEKFGVMKTLTKPFAKSDLLNAVDQLLDI